MPGIDPEAANVRRLVVKLLLARVDEPDSYAAVLEEIRGSGADVAVAVLSDVADLAAATLTKLHGPEEATLTLNRLAAADLEEEALNPG
jgi:hypothetical protein